MPTSPRNDTLLTATDHCVFTSVDVIESFIMALLFKDKVYIEDNGWFLDGKFVEYCLEEQSLVVPALKEGYLVPTFRSQSNSFEEYLVDSGMLKHPSMGVAGGKKLLELASTYDANLPNIPIDDMIRRVSDKEVGHYDEVLTRLLLGEPPLRGLTGSDEANILRIWTKYSHQREAWLSEAFRIRDQGRDGRPFNSAAKGSFVKLAAQYLHEDGVNNATELFDLRKKSQTHSDVCQIVKWAHDAYYIARGETLNTGYGIFMPSMVEAAMVLKEQSTVGVATDSPFQILIETFLPPMKSLAKADPSRLLECRRKEGALFISNIQGWSRSCHDAGQEAIETKEWENDLKISFSEYGKALRACCSDGGVGGTPMENFLANVTTKVSLASAFGIFSAEAFNRYSTSIHQYLTTAGDAIGHLKNTVTVTAAGALSASAWVLYGYSIRKRTSAHVGSESGVSVVNRAISGSQNTIPPRNSSLIA